MILALTPTRSSTQSAWSTSLRKASITLSFIFIVIESLIPTKFVGAIISISTITKAMDAYQPSSHEASHLSMLLNETRIKRILDVLKKKKREGDKKTVESDDIEINGELFPIAVIRKAIIPLRLKNIRPSRPLSENRDIMGWERLGWSWK